MVLKCKQKQKMSPLLGSCSLFGKVRLMQLLQLVLQVTVLTTVVQSSRAPETLSAEVPDVKLWCPDAKLGNPTRSTGECICKYGCEGKNCVRMQGFNFYTWKDGVAGLARCVPPKTMSDAQVEQQAAIRRAEKERLTQEQAESRSRADQAQAAFDLRESVLAQGKAATWEEWLEDLDWSKITVAVVVSLCFGSVLLGMVFVGMVDVRDAVNESAKHADPTESSKSSKSTTSTPSKSDKND